MLTPLSLWQLENTELLLVRPTWLLLAPVLLALWWWLQSRSATTVVGSTFLWRRVSQSRRNSKQWATLAFFLLLCMATSLPLTAPRIPSPTEPQPHVLPARAGQKAAQLEITFAAKAATHAVAVYIDELEWLSAEHQSQDEHPTVATWELPRVGSPQSIRVIIDGVSWKLLVPPPHTPLVFDETGSVAVQDALTAFVEAGLYERASRAETADCIITRAGSEAAIAKLLLPSRDATPADFLPPIDRNESPHRLLEGLEPESWTLPEVFAWPARDVDEVFLDSPRLPLIARSGRDLLLGFDPDRSDLPERAAWPVLLGRLLEELTPPAAAAPTRTGATSFAPTWALLGVALTLIPWVANALWTRMLLVGLLLGAGALVSWPVRGAPQTVEASPGNPFDSLPEAAQKLPRGGILEVPDGLLAPLAAAPMSSWLESRGLVLRRQSPEPSDELTVDRKRIEIGDEITLRLPISGAAADRGASGGTEELLAFGPDGSQQLLTWEAEASVLRATHSPTLPGLWHYGPRRPDTGFGVCRVEVVARPQCLLLQGRSGLGSASLVDSEQFAVTSWSPDAAQEWALPTPPESSIILWDGLDPARISGTHRKALSQWVRQGGTLFTATTAPFFEPSPGKDWFDEILPAPFPPPQRRPDVDLGILLVDVSGSLRDQQQALVRGIQDLWEASPDGARWGLAYFHQKPGWVVPPGSALTDEVVERIATLRTAGGTDLASAMEFVEREFRDTGGLSRSLVLVTDGRTPWSVREAEQTGKRLRQAGVRTVIIALGASPRIDLLEALARGSAGRLVQGNQGESRTVLADLLVPTPDRSSPYVGSIQRGSWHPLLEAMPKSLPAPQQGPTLIPKPQSTALWIDTRGRGLLHVQSWGQGRTLLYASGLDDDSLPRGGGARRIKTALRDVLLTATRQAPRLSRQTESVVDQDGRSWVLLERFPGEPGILDLELASGTDEWIPGRVGATSVARYAVPHLDPERSLRIRHEESVAIVLPGSPGDLATAWRVAADASTTAGTPLPLELLLLLGVVVVVGVRGIRRNPKPVLTQASNSLSRTSNSSGLG